LARPIAIGARLARFPEIHTLGVRPNLADYPPEHLELIRTAPKVYYPTQALAPQLHALSRPMFPSLMSHLLEGDKIMQTRMLELAGLPHPRTRVFYGNQRAHILEHFAFPFVAKTPRASAGGLGVFLIQDQAGLDAYVAANQPAYIQELMPLERDVRVVCIGYDPVIAYWRLADNGDFRTNVAQGGRVDFEGVPAEAVELAVTAAKVSGMDDVGVDVAMAAGGPVVLEMNVKYGHKGAAQAGLDLRRYVVEKILAGEL